MKNIFYLMLSVIFLGCVTQKYIDQKTFDSIPVGSNTVTAFFDVPVDTVYKIVYSELLNGGWRISSTDKEMKMIDTDVKQLDGDTHLRMNIHAKPFESGSMVTIRGQWTFGTTTSIALGKSINQSWNTVIMGYDGTKPTIAFCYMSAFANICKPKIIKYSKS